MENFFVLVSYDNLSVESQKGIDTSIKWYCFENQKGTVIIESVQQYHPSDSQQNGINALLALNWQYSVMNLRWKSFYLFYQSMPLIWEHTFLLLHAVGIYPRVNPVHIISLEHLGEGREELTHSDGEDPKIFIPKRK